MERAQAGSRKCGPAVAAQSQQKKVTICPCVSGCVFCRSVSLCRRSKCPFFAPVVLNRRHSTKGRTEFCRYSASQRRKGAALKWLRPVKWEGKSACYLGVRVWHWVRRATYILLVLVIAYLPDTFVHACEIDVYLRPSKGFIVRTFRFFVDKRAGALLYCCIAKVQVASCMPPPRPPSFR